MVRLKGLEPSRLATLDPKSSASTNSATSACDVGAKVQHFFGVYGKNTIIFSLDCVILVCLFCYNFALVKVLNYLYSICQS